MASRGAEGRGRGKLRLEWCGTAGELKLNIIDRAHQASSNCYTLETIEIETRLEMVVSPRFCNVIGDRLGDMYVDGVMVFEARCWMRGIFNMLGEGDEITGCCGWCCVRVVCGGGCGAQKTSELLVIGL